MQRPAPVAWTAAGAPVLLDGDRAAAMPPGPLTAPPPWTSDRCTLVVLHRTGPAAAIYRVLLAGALALLVLDVGVRYVQRGDPQRALLASGGVAVYVLLLSQRSRRIRRVPPVYAQERMRVMPRVPPLRWISRAAVLANVVVVLILTAEVADGSAADASPVDVLAPPVVAGIVALVLSMELLRSAPAALRATERVSGGTFFLGVDPGWLLRHPGAHPMWLFVPVPAAVTAPGPPPAAQTPGSSSRPRPTGYGRL